MNGYILAISIGVASVGLLFAGAQTARLSKSQTELAASEAKLVEVRAKLERANESRAAMETTLATERDRAVAAEREAGDLRERIAADAGTARDGATAPVLLDVLRRLGGQPK